VTLERLNALLDSFASMRIAILGDFLLDEYIIGSTARVSREAPIAVVDYQETLHRPGGAANAAQNVCAAGATAVAVGVCGADREGEVLVSLLEGRGVDTSAMARDASYTTPLKLRILAGEMNAQKQQVARVDRSAPLVPTPELMSRLHDSVATAVAGCDAALISDYGVGIVPGELSEGLIARCGERGIPAVVDSRFELISYSGATLATPNEVEALAAVGARDESRLRAGELGRLLIERSGIGQFIITRGSKGMLVCDSSGETPIGIVGSDEATDVTGAGDTVSAYVTLSLACGASAEEAAWMATYAAAVVVMKRGTATATPAEVRALAEHHAAR
jgi:rfaE bifunctional protein kinase chain/domain